MADTSITSPATGPISRPEVLPHETSRSTEKLGVTETVTNHTTGLENFIRVRKPRQSAPKTHRKTGAVVLLRVSSQRQLISGSDVDSDGNSIATQRQYAGRKLSELHAPLVKEFIEPAQSAQSIAKRPIFRQLLEFVRENTDLIGYVIVYSRARAFRNDFDAAYVEHEFEALGIELISATEDFGSDRHQARLMKGIQDSFNAYQYRANGRDVSRKMLHKVEMGGSIGRAKIGYLNDRSDVDGRLVPTIAVDEVRAPLIRWAFEAYATGEYSLTDLRESLGDQGLRTRPTKRWPSQPISQSRLNDVLRDPYYCGVIIYKGNAYPGRHEQLISKELFLRVQAILDERSQRGQRDVVHYHWAKGLIWCQRCYEAGRTSRLIYTEAKGNGGIYEYFICRGRQEGTCDLPSLSVATVEEAIGDAFGSLTVTKDYIESIRHHVDTAIEQSQEMERYLRSNLKNELRKLDIKEERLLDLAGEVDLQTLRLRERLKDIQLRRGEIEERLAITDEQIIRGVQAVHAYLDMLASARALFKRADDSARRLLIEAAFSQVRLDIDAQADVELREPTAQAVEAVAVIRSSTGDKKAAKTRPSATESAHHAPEQRQEGGVGSLADFLLTSGLSKPYMAGVPGLEPRTTEPESASPGSPRVYPCRTSPENQESPLGIVALSRSESAT